MNRIYRLVYSNVLNAWVAVSEISRGHGAKKASRAAVALALAPLCLNAHAAPTGGVVTSGVGRIVQTQSNNGSVNTTITQGSQYLNLNWSGFNVGTNETVSFIQPNALSVAVNRIYDTNGAQIDGHLNANGQIFLIDPNGIIFGKGAQVNVGGLVA
ncbi:secreted protein containing Filamentous hemagglutinin, partial [mine drainage metagenome]